MAILLIVLLVLGLLVMLAGDIVMLVAAFRVSVVWGLLCLFLPPARLVFLIKHWTEARLGFLLQIGGLALVLSGIFVPMALGARRTVVDFHGLPAAVSRRVSQPAAPPAGGSAGWLTRRTPAPVPATNAAPRGGESLVGLTLEEVRAMLGPPKAMLRTETGAVYQYPGLELVSDDGKTVTSQGRPTREASPTAKDRAPAGGARR